ncbi:MAG TPA: hypothetical protein VGK94_03255 [Candidatus Polarisedimenticolia bacterium]|jgi:hypothetical protein
MQTVGELLVYCGRRLAPFERLRVGKVGCGAALGAIAVTGAMLAFGLWDTAGSWKAGFRFVVLSALATVILLFVLYAMAETVVERSVRRGLRSYLRESGMDLETLTRAAEIRSGSIAGGHRLLALLKEIGSP